MECSLNIGRKLFLHAAHRTVGMSAGGISSAWAELGDVPFDGCADDCPDDSPPNASPSRPENRENGGEDE